MKFYDSCFHFSESGITIQQHRIQPIHTSLEASSLNSGARSRTLHNVTVNSACLPPTAEKSVDSSRIDRGRTGREKAEGVGELLN